MTTIVVVTALANRRRWRRRGCSHGRAIQPAPTCRGVGRRQQLGVEVVEQKELGVVVSSACSWWWYLQCVLGVVAQPVA